MLCVSSSSLQWQTAPYRTGQGVQGRVGQKVYISIRQPLPVLQTPFSGFPQLDRTSNSRGHNKSSSRLFPPFHCEEQQHKDDGWGDSGKRLISKEWWGMEDRGQSRQEYNCYNLRFGQASVILCCAVKEVRLAKPGSVTVHLYREASQRATLKTFLKSS